MSTNDLRRRPNTGVPISFLHENVVLCCGEDAGELLVAVTGATSPPLYPPIPHCYRDYTFWPFPNFTLARASIGTGSLEPLLKEILEANVVRRIVLIGTAGFIGDDPAALGKVYLVDEAYAAACAVERAPEAGPLTPRFDNLDQITLPRAATMSTDHYYGYSRRDSPYVTRAHAADARLKAAVEQYWQSGRLIEMETAQLYHFCRVYDLTDTVQFVALRGVANRSDCFEEQGDHSLQVLQEAFRQAMLILGLHP